MFCLIEKNGFYVEIKSKGCMNSIVWEMGVKLRKKNSRKDQLIFASTKLQKIERKLQMKFNDKLYQCYYSNFIIFLIHAILDLKINLSSSIWFHINLF